MNRILNNIKEFLHLNQRPYSLIYKWLLIVIACFVIYYTLIIAVIPVLNYEYILPEQNPKSRGPKHDLSQYYSLPDSLMNRSKELANNEAYLLARLEMAKDDSICIALDLKDSSVSLIVQGVTIYSSRISSYKSSSLFSKSDPFLTSLYFSWPFRIEEYSASIPKIPVIIRKAPRDTIEAASLPEPGQLEESQNYVLFQFKLDRKLGIIFEQDSISDLIDKKAIKYFIRQQKKVKKKAIRNALIRAGPMEYLPEIHVKLNRQAALVIFRAFPENADIAIRLNPNH